MLYIARITHTAPDDDYIDKLARGPLQIKILMITSSRINRQHKSDARVRCTSCIHIYYNKSLEKNVTEFDGATATQGIRVCCSRNGLGNEREKTSYMYVV